MLAKVQYHLFPYYKFKIKQNFRCFGSFIVLIFYIKTINLLIISYIIKWFNIEVFI